MHRAKILITAALIALGALASAVHAGDPDWIARSKTGMVASDSPEASQIGADVLKAGGNAFDAAVATSFALAVARPQSTGLGGGGFMVAYVASADRFIALDFRETAPAGATPERYAELFAKRGDGPSPSVYGGNAVCVPGQLAGLADINQRFGTRPLADLIAPAIMLAEGGFVVDESFLGARLAVLKDAAKWPQLAKKHATLYEHLSPSGAAPGLGERFKRPDLVKSLRLIAQHGPDVFYDGPIGEAIVAAVRKAGGTLTAEDLRAYQVKERQPHRFRFGLWHGKSEAVDCVTMPPPSSGGFCLSMMEDFEGLCSLDELGNTGEPFHYFPHVQVEAMKHAFAHRAKWLGDPDFTDIPMSRLLSTDRVIDLIHRYYDSEQTRPSSVYGDAAAPPDDGGTSHFCVGDKDGNIVALTETINGSFGSLVVAEPYGIILNNEMDDFLTVRGQSNMFELVQSEANLVAPGKRPLSSMSPSILVREGKPVLAIGASGGPRIITSTYTVARRVMFGDTLEEAMTALRIHHQWQPDEIYFDREPPAGMVAQLESHGHKVSDKRRSGIVQAIQFLDDGTMVGASDPKKGGRPAAVP
jgi:gamma-glutamyltranspeptidase/glutathione hydrolase